MKRILEGEDPEDGEYADGAEVEYLCTDERRSLGFITYIISSSSTGDGRLATVGWRDDLHHV
jgi:hypothetical protein